MPRDVSPAAPLRPDQVSQFLRGIADPPPSVRPELALQALHATLDELATWCSPVALASAELTFAHA